MSLKKLVVFALVVPFVASACAVIDEDGGAQTVQQELKGGVPGTNRCDAPDGAVYIADAEQCTVIRFMCAEGTEGFWNDCGCGCAPVTPSCVVSGCSGQVCVEEGSEVITTCEYQPEYACYANLGTCERQRDGECGWTNTRDLRQCLRDPASYGF